LATVSGDHDRRFDNGNGRVIQPDVLCDQRATRVVLAEQVTAIVVHILAEAAAASVAGAGPTGSLGALPSTARLAHALTERIDRVAGDDRVGALQSCTAETISCAVGVGVSTVAAGVASDVVAASGGSNCI